MSHGPRRWHQWPRAPVPPPAQTGLSRWCRRRTPGSSLFDMLRSLGSPLLLPLLFLCLHPHAAVAQRRLTLPTWYHYSYMWDYSDFSTWTNNYPDCAQLYQSPIDISTDIGSIQPLPLDHVQLPSHSLSFVDYTLFSGDIIVIARSEHVVKVSFSSNAKRIPRISVLALNDTFLLDHIVFHSSLLPDTLGSEHHLDGRQYSAELQLYHYSQHYSTFAKAAEHYEALLAVSVLFRIDPQESSTLHELMKYASRLLRPGNNPYRVKLADHGTFKLQELLPPLSADSGYFLYPGSLTQPPCYETITWLVMATSSKISRESVAVLADLVALPALANDSSRSYVNANSRPVQAVNNRTIHYYVLDSLRHNDLVEARKHSSGVPTKLPWTTWVAAIPFGLVITAF